MWMSWWSWHSKDMGKCLFFSSFASRWALWGHIDPFHEYLEFVQPSSACGHWTRLGPQLSSFHPSFHYFLPYSLRNVPSITIFPSTWLALDSEFPPCPCRGSMTRWEPQCSHRTVCGLRHPVELGSHFITRLVKAICFICLAGLLWGLKIWKSTQVWGLL